MSNWCCEVDSGAAACRSARGRLVFSEARECTSTQGIIFISSFIGNLQNAEVKTDGLADRGTHPWRYTLVLDQLVLFLISESCSWAKITHAFKQRIIAEELPWNHELQLGDGAVGEYRREPWRRMHLQDIEQYSSQNVYDLH